MAFVRATIQLKPASIGTGIKCGLRRTKKSSAKLSFSLSVAVAAQLDIADGNGIEVMIGDGEHHGLIRFRKNNSAADTKAERRSTGKGDFFLVNLGHQPSYVDQSEASLWCQWEKIEDGWVEVVLPKWADETAPVKKPKMEPLSRVAPTQPTARNSVTSSVMGDPPPGRRQMLEEMDRISRRVK